MNVRILRDRRGKPDLLGTTAARVMVLISEWKSAVAGRRSRINTVLVELGFHLTERT